MKRYLLVVSLIYFFSTATAQQVFTIRLVDAESSQPVKQAKINLKGTTYLSNQLGFFQLSANPGDTITVEHEAYSRSMITLPAEPTFQVKLAKEEKKIACSWTSINFQTGNYYYRPVKIADGIHAYLILVKKKKAYLVLYSEDPSITNFKNLNLQATSFATVLNAVDMKTSFEVLPDKVTRGKHYFTIEEKAKEGLYFNFFEVERQQINSLQNQLIVSIRLDGGTPIQLDRLTGRTLGVMFGCVD